MLQYLKKLFCRDLLVELSEAKLVIKEFSGNEIYEEEPYIAIEKTSKGQIVKAIGAKAKLHISPSIDVSNPFKHSRSFVGDFYKAQKLLQYGILDMHKRAKFKLSPRVIMHQLEKSEGGLTDVEERTLKELAIGAGAREVIVYVGSKIAHNVETYDSIKSRLVDS